MSRPRLQLHLSTLLIVTLLAGALVWLNVRGRFSYEFDASTHHEIGQCYGFPFDCYTAIHRTWYREKSSDPNFDDKAEALAAARQSSWGEVQAAYTKADDVLKVTILSQAEGTKPVLLNIAICLALLSVAAVVIEWLTRRMKRGGP